MVALLKLLLILTGVRAIIKRDCWRVTVVLAVARYILVVLSIHASTPRGLGRNTNLIF